MVSWRGDSFSAKLAKIRKGNKKVIWRTWPRGSPYPAFSISIQIKNLLTDKSEIEFLAEEAPSEQDKESDKNPKGKEKEKRACKNPLSENDGGSKTDLLKANPEEDRCKDEEDDWDSEEEVAEYHEGDEERTIVMIRILQESIH